MVNRCHVVSRDHRVGRDHKGGREGGGAGTTRIARGAWTIGGGGQGP
jgi:hypothetical protein